DARRAPERGIDGLNLEISSDLGPDELDPPNLGGAQRRVLGQGLLDPARHLLRRDVGQGQTQQVFPRVAELLDHALAHVHGLERRPDPVHRHRLLEADLDQGATREVDPVAQAAPGHHGPDTGQDEEDRDDVGPGAPADEVEVGVLEELEHGGQIESDSRLRGPMYSRSKSNRVKKTAVKRLAAIPIIRVTAKPLTGPVPNWKRMRPETSTVTWVSMT